MGLQHVDLIFEPLIPGLTTAQTLILCRLATRANEKHLCWPGATLLAREARMTVRGVYKVLRELEQAQIITKRKGTYETHYRTLYEMTYAVEQLKKLEQEQATTEYPPANNHHSLSLENADFLARLYQDLAARKQWQADYIQAKGKEHPAIAGVIDLLERRIAKLENM